jgi:hypothetical protein
MKEFHPGDLISTLDYTGKKYFAIVIECKKRFGYIEMVILYEGRTHSVVFDGVQDVITLEQEV